MSRAPIVIPDLERHAARAHTAVLLGATWWRQRHHVSQSC